MSDAVTWHENTEDDREIGAFLDEVATRAAATPSPSITCPRCGRTSHHPTDVAEGYCGACHDWTTVPPPAAAKVTELPPAGPPPSGACDHCGCAVTDWGEGWEYVESDERLPEYDGGRDCPDGPGRHIYHEVGGRENAEPSTEERT